MLGIAPFPNNIDAVLVIGVNDRMLLPEVFIAIAADFGNILPGLPGQSPIRGLGIFNLPIIGVGMVSIKAIPGDMNNIFCVNSPI